MSRPAMQAILDRACKDMRFNVKMIENPAAAFAEYDLTDEEKDALVSCERTKLVEVGLDERMTAWIPWQWAATRRRQI